MATAQARDLGLGQPLYWVSSTCHPALLALHLHLLPHCSCGVGEMARDPAPLCVALATCAAAQDRFGWFLSRVAPVVYLRHIVLTHSPARALGPIPSLGCCERPAVHTAVWLLPVPRRHRSPPDECPDLELGDGGAV